MLLHLDRTEGGAAWNQILEHAWPMPLPYTVEEHP